MAQLTEQEIRTELAALRHDVRWAHHFELGYGIETVRPEDGDFYRKAVGLKAFADLFPAILRGFMNRDSFAGLQCLDLGSAEGCHAIEIATMGAASVLGLEGRQLYVDRARFAARALGVVNATFEWADVRKLDVKNLGQFDFVLCSGLLHHLNKDAFLDFTQFLFDSTRDTLLLYTHVSSEWVVKKFNLKPTGAVDGRYKGALYREHADRATTKQRVEQVRASLDNTFSFWATEPALMQRFSDLGFKTIVKLYQPAFALTWVERVFRGVWVLRRSMM